MYEPEAKYEKSSAKILTYGNGKDFLHSSVGGGFFNRSLDIQLRFLKEKLIIEVVFVDLFCYQKYSIIEHCLKKRLN